MFKLLAIVALIIDSGFIVNKVLSMSNGLGKKQTFVIVSPFRAKLTDGGQPIKNAVITLRYSWNSGSDDDEAGYTKRYKSDSEGVVEIPAIEKEIFVSNVQKTASNYTISVTVKGAETEFHTVSKSNPAMHGELEKELIGLTCDIGAPWMMVVNPGAEGSSLFGTKCEWPDRKNLQVEEL